MRGKHSKVSNGRHQCGQIYVLHHLLSFLLHLASQNIEELNIEGEGGTQRTRPTVIVDLQPTFLLPKTVFQLD